MSRTVWREGDVLRGRASGGVVPFNRGASFGWGWVCYSCSAVLGRFIPLRVTWKQGKVRLLHCPQPAPCCPSCAGTGSGGYVDVREAGQVRVGGGSVGGVGQVLAPYEAPLQGRLALRRGP